MAGSVEVTNALLKIIIRQSKTNKESETKQNPITAPAPYAVLKAKDIDYFAAYVVL